MSENFVKEKAVIKGRVEGTYVTVDFRVCIITESSFDRSEALLFQECTALSQLSAGSEYIWSSSGDAFVFQAATARERSDSIASEGLQWLLGYLQGRILGLKSIKIARTYCNLGQ